MCRAVVSIALLTLVSAACGSREVSPSAEACATVVKQVRGAPGGVEVRSAADTAEGQAEIDYEYLDGENIPVTGSAACTFAAGRAGSLELIEAIVDGASLGASEVSAANRALSQRGM